jgi:hypothetical protein
MSMTPEFLPVRRQDRAVQDEAWIAAFLGRAPFGVLALANGNQPYAKPNLFAYDAARHAIYLHAASEGRTFESVAQNPKACFTAGEMGRLLPAAAARGFSVEYASVTAFGLIQVVQDQAEAQQALGLLMRKYAAHLQPGEDYQPVESGDLGGVTVYRLDIHSWSGKRKQADPDFPGAYRFEAAE